MLLIRCFAAASRYRCNKLGSFFVGLLCLIVGVVSKYVTSSPFSKTRTPFFLMWLYEFYCFFLQCRCPGCGFESICSKKIHLDPVAWPTYIFHTVAYLHALVSVSLWRFSPNLVFLVGLSASLWFFKVNYKSEMVP